MSLPRHLLRRSAILASGAMAALLLTSASASAAPFLLSVDTEAGTVSTIDTATNSTFGSPVYLPGRPQSIAIAPDAGHAFVTEEGPDQVVTIDLATRQVVGEPIDTVDEPGPIALAPDGLSAYVVVRSLGAILAIDTVGDRVKGAIALSAGPSAIAVAPDGKSAYVAEEGAEAVQRVDLQTLQESGPPIELEAPPRDIAIAPDGKTVYVADGARGLAEIGTTTGRVGYIPTGSAEAVAISPDGSTAVVSHAGEGLAAVDLRARSVTAEAATDPNPTDPAITPDGRFVYVGVSEFPDSYIDASDAHTLEGAAAPISTKGPEAALTVTPDQSPTALPTGPTTIVAGSPAQFDGAASTDPDGRVADWDWTFGDGGTASGIGPVHSYSTPGAYDVTLSVRDEAGCGEEVVFTGQTAYCSGNPAAKAARRITVTAPPAPPSPSPPAPVCRTVPRVLRVAHRLGNGTARLTLRIPAAGSIFLFGKKVHAVTRRATEARTIQITLHARVEVNKRLKKERRTGVRYRVTFFPAAGCSATTVHRSLALLRAPRKTRH